MLLMQRGIGWKSLGTRYFVGPPQVREPGGVVATTDSLQLWRAAPYSGQCIRGYTIAPDILVGFLVDDLNRVRVDVSKASQVALRACSPGPADGPPSVVENTGGLDIGIPLVLFDTVYPGWRAYVDGVGYPIWAYDTAFRTVPLPEGAKQAEMVYYPASVACGLFVSLLALMALTALATASRGCKGGRAQ
jgi:hypothetical protein